MIGPGEAEGGAEAFFGGDLDVASAAFDDAFDEGQADAGAGTVGLEFQALEEGEDLFVEAGRDAGAVVGDGEFPGIAEATGGDLEVAFGFVHELDRVVDQVEEELVELMGQAGDGGEGIGDADLEVGGGIDEALEFADEPVEIDLGFGFAAMADPAVGEDAVDQGMEFADPALEFADQGLAGVAELGGVVFSEPVGEAGDAAEGGLEVVGDGIDEVGQFAVGLLEGFGALADEDFQLFLGLTKDLIGLALAGDIFGDADAGGDATVGMPAMGDAGADPAEVGAGAVDAVFGGELVSALLGSLPLGKDAVAIAGMDHLPPDAAGFGDVAEVGDGLPAAVAIAEAPGGIGDEDAAGCMLAEQLEQFGAFPAGDVVLGEVGVIDELGDQEAVGFGVGEGEGAGFDGGGLAEGMGEEEAEFFGCGFGEPLVAGGTVIGMHQGEEVSFGGGRLVGFADQFPERPIGEDELSGTIHDSEALGGALESFAEVFLDAGEPGRGGGSTGGFGFHGSGRHR